MSSGSVDPLPWYRDRWPWFLISLPAIAVAFSLYAAYLAVHGADTVIDADYYKHGLAINEELDRAHKAEALGIAADLGFDGLHSGDSVRVSMTAAHPPAAEPTLQVRLLHPTRPSADRVALLSRVAGGSDDAPQYLGAWQPTEDVNGRIAWRVVIEAKAWRLESDLPESAGMTDHLRIAAGK
ncbi:MAG TPA: FixH family protein [Burkholderiaceae bacterium]|nr:FixH family protein [Burkholderiaceae bacterium]